VVIAVLVLYLGITRKDIQRPEEAVYGPAGGARPASGARGGRARSSPVAPEALEPDL
jgi:hypothetical protein